MFGAPVSHLELTRCVVQCAIGGSAVLALLLLWWQCR